MTSTALIIRYPYDVTGAADWLATVLQQRSATHRDIRQAEYDLANLRQELEWLDNDFQDTNNRHYPETPEVQCLWHRFHLQHTGAQDRIDRNWGKPSARLSAQSAVLTCWVNFFTGNPNWEPTLFESTTRWDHEDVRSFIRISRVSVQNPSDYMPWQTPAALIAPHWFHQLLTTACEDSLAGSRLREQEKLAPWRSVIRQLDPEVGSALAVPTATVLTNALTLWSPRSPDDGEVYKTLAASVEAAQRL